MVARAAAAEATAERIIDAAVTLFWEQPSDQIRLTEVARRAEVTVQTVLRRFGSKEDLFAAAAAREVARVRSDRAGVRPGDVAGAVTNLVDHYERDGDGVLRLLAEEHASAAMRDAVASGRTVHRRWCRTVFAPYLDGLDRTTAARRTAQLVAICDVYTWKLLRRDSGLSRAQTLRAIEEMLAPFTKEAS
ncbi:MAG TPA: helix-turn-helix domain-containing protein [Angustibacter sp.]|nr:helix-turn-helix domain-containing protein [Angustibacter sp.]